VHGRFTRLAVDYCAAVASSRATSTYDFQGLRFDGLTLMHEAARAYGLSIDAIRPRSAESAGAFYDCFSSAKFCMYACD